METKDMYKSVFGRVGQVRFLCHEDYYEILGFLAKSDGSTALVWENNEEQGAWGSEGRICFYTKKIPQKCFKYTAGRGSIYKRVNCNDYVFHIAKYHNFVAGKSQNIAAIRSTIPSQYLEFFEKGLNF